MLNYESYQEWVKDQGDSCHLLNYNLDKNSVVVDLGGFEGIWTTKVIDKFNPNVYIIEPLPDYYNIMVNKFKNNDKVSLLNVGVSSENRKGVIFSNGDSSSSNSTHGTPVDVEFLTIKSILNLWNIKNIDLLQINIEGDEYSLLESMIETDIIDILKNIQVQFHLGVDNCIERRDSIRENLKIKGFELNFDYPFVWESWRNVKASI